MNIKFDATFQHFTGLSPSNTAREPFDTIDIQQDFILQHGIDLWGVGKQDKPLEQLLGEWRKQVFDISSTYDTYHTHLRLLNNDDGYTQQEAFKVCINVLALKQIRELNGLLRNDSRQTGKDGSIQIVKSIKDLEYLERERIDIKARFSPEDTTLDSDLLLIETLIYKLGLHGLLKYAFDLVVAMRDIIGLRRVLICKTEDDEVTENISYDLAVARLTEIQEYLSKPDQYTGLENYKEDIKSIIDIFIHFNIGEQK